MKMTGDSNIFAVYDINVKDYAMRVAEEFGASGALGITADEEHKTLESVGTIASWLLENGADRNALVLAIGGGVTTDLCGFAASVYKRGVRYANFPTTLLSMVDAAIGGKTGCNLNGHKNMLGSFCNPEFTRYDISSLSTLPEKEWKSGIAELLKTFIIADSDAYREAVGFFSTFRYSEADFSEAVNNGSLAGLIRKAADIKAGIVRKDPREAGLRKVLNLGHTWAHAIEWWQRQAGGDEASMLSHGEAVAVGIACSARLSEKLGLCKEGLAASIAADLKDCGLGTELPCPESELFGAMSKDKKASGGKVDFILIRKIGKVEIKALAPEEI